MNFLNLLYIFCTYNFLVFLFYVFKFNDNTADIKQQIKHKINGKYPFITYKNPAATDEIAST